MKFIQTIVLAVATLATITTATAQSSKKVTETVVINGNCGMCKQTIEKAANDKNTKLVWSPDTKTAKVTYNSSKTSLDDILKRVANVGYDNQKYKSTDAVYNNLHGCCQYDRDAKLATTKK